MTSAFGWASWSPMALPSISWAAWIPGEDGGRYTVEQIAGELGGKRATVNGVWGMGRFFLSR
jgi:hypothetical protein